jgi:hypothetical protein
MLGGDDGVYGQEGGNTEQIRRLSPLVQKRKQAQLVLLSAVKYRGTFPDKQDESAEF